MHPLPWRSVSVEAAVSAALAVVASATNALANAIFDPELAFILQ